MSRLRVLIVEDSEDDTTLLLRELRQGGYDPVFRRVDTHAHMKKALKKHSWDIVVSDYVMPGFNGLEALKLLKDIDPDIPFILVSGKIGEDIAVEAMKMGAHDFIMKDNFTRLVPAIDRELKESKIRKKRKKAEKALKESETLYKTIFENTGTATVITEDDTTISLVNAEFEKLSGYSKEEIESKKSWTEFFVKEDLERMQEYHRLRATDPSVPSNYESRFVDREGNVRNVFITVSIIQGTKRSVASLLDITDHKKVDTALKASLKEKEILLQEINHRVKNNMQIISSLLSLQSRYLEDENVIELFKDSQNRVRSMSLVHEKLYQSVDMTRVNFENYVKTLINDLFRSYGTGFDSVTLITDVDNLFLDVDTAIPCGLIINELVTNSLKHAFSHGKKGKINVIFHSNGNEYVLMVGDNGTGFPRGLDMDNVKTLGLRLVQTLTDQLKGTIELERDSGTTFKITFKQR